MALEYLLQFANVPFVPDTGKVVRLAHKHQEVSSTDQDLAPLKHQPLADLVDELNRMIPFKYLQDFSLPSTYPGRNVDGIAFQPQADPQPNSTLRLFDWYYPYGASRWSVFRGLATSSQAKAMLAATGGYGRATFIMGQNPIAPYHLDNDVSPYRLTSQMFMLPPRPLAEHGGRFDGLYLITLVDERYYFQGTPVSLHVTGNTSWLDLITQIRTALGGINITVDPIPSAYPPPEPDSPLWTNLEQVTTLLDAIAYNIGMVVVRDLGGTYSLIRPQTSQAIVFANLKALNDREVRVAGGAMFSSGVGLPVGSLRASRNSVVPARINFTYPKYVFGDDPVPHFLNPRYANQRPSAWLEQSYGDVYTITVPITAGGINTSGLQGVSDLTIHDTAKALFRSEFYAGGNAAPDNLPGLAALSLQEAVDYYEHQLVTALDEIFPGTFAWQAEGTHDIIWTYSARSRRATTRVMRTEWSSAATEMQHTTPPYSNTTTSQQRGIGGLSVAQTVRDQVSGTTITPKLAGTLLADQGFALIGNIGFLPTQNRWRGQIDNEVILFEGTSGGVPGRVDVAFRGYDGTVAVQHDNLSPVTYLTPDVTYGTNLVTWEKNQWVHPAEQTSGGIQGARAIPQTQTIFIIPPTSPGQPPQTGLERNGVIYWSGSVQLFDAAVPGTNPWQRQEYCWVAERDKHPLNPGNRYDGTYAGPSPVLDGGTAPLYLVDEVLASRLGCDIQSVDCVADCGTSDLAARADHVHDYILSDEVPEPVEVTGLFANCGPGTSCLPSRSDHSHCLTLDFSVLNGTCSQPASWLETDVICDGGYLKVYFRLVTLTFVNNCPYLARSGWWLAHYAGCCDCVTPPPTPSPILCTCCGCRYVPLQWKLTGVTGVSPGGNCSQACASFNADWTLNYRSQCVWDTDATSVCPGVETLKTWTLSCDGTYWILAPATSDGCIQYRLAVSKWSCLGVNVLDLVQSCADCHDWPAKVTLTGQDGVVDVGIACTGVGGNEPPTPPADTIQTSCCTNPVRTTLQASFSDFVPGGPPGSGACDCFTGLVITLIYDPTSRHWCGTSAACGVSLEFFCSFAGDGLWHLVIGSGDCAGAAPGTTADAVLSSCDPNFKQVFLNFVLPAGAFGCTATVTIMP